MNASPKNVGTINGFKVPIQWIRTKIAYRGTMVTWLGSIRVAITRMKITRRPRHSIRDSA